MANRILPLQDGVLVEVTEFPDPVPGRASAVESIDQGIDAIKPTLLRVCQPIVEAWNMLNSDISMSAVAISEAEVEFGLGFEGEGNLFVSKMTAGANLVVKLKLHRVNPVVTVPRKARKRG